MRWYFSRHRWEYPDVALSYKIEFQVKGWESLGLSGIILVLQQNRLMVWSCAAKRRQWLGEGNVLSMKWGVPGQDVDQRKLGERLWKKTARHVNWTGRMLWIVIVGGSRWWMIDEHNRCDIWVGECFFWYWLTRVVPDKIQRAVKWL